MALLPSGALWISINLCQGSIFTSIKHNARSAAVPPDYFFWVSFINSKTPLNGYEMRSLQKGNRNNIPCKACWRVCQGQGRQKARSVRKMPEQVPEERRHSQAINEISASVA